MKRFAGLALFLIVVLVYIPAMRSAFVWDDDSFVTHNPIIHDAHGLARFWWSTDPPDYFPLTWTTMWVEWRLFGMNPTGYHVINVLLHALSTLILWRVLRRLAVPGAWLAALAFGLHPVNVESAAWITERKNTVPMVFYFLTLLCYLTFEDTRRRRYYVLALLCFLLALLGKTSVVMLPFVLLLLAWWRRGRVTRTDLARTAAFLPLSLGLGLATVWFQLNRAIATDVVRTDGLASRCAIAARAVWFYLGKVLWPADLTPVYPRWVVDPHALVAYLPMVALIGAAVVLWMQRKRMRPVVVGLAFFALNLLPVLGFVNIYYMRYSFVADHWQYFSIAGITTLVVGLGAHALSAHRRVALTAGAVVAIALAAATWQHQAYFSDLETLWTRVLARDESVWMAHQNLGRVLEQRGDYPGAARHYARALAIEPEFPEAHSSYGAMLVKLGRVDDALTHFAEAIREKPSFAEAHANLGGVLHDRGDFARAEQHLRRACELRPNHAVQLHYLGKTLLALGRPTDALASLQAALTLRARDPDLHLDLARTLIALGQRDEAAQALRTVLQLDPRNARAAKALNQLGQ